MEETGLKKELRKWRAKEKKENNGMKKTDKRKMGGKERGEGKYGSERVRNGTV